MREGTEISCEQFDRQRKLREFEFDREREEANQWFHLRETLLAAQHFAVDLDVSDDEFARLWAPRWFEVYHQLERLRLVDEAKCAILPAGTVLCMARTLLFGLREKPDTNALAHVLGVAISRVRPMPEREALRAFISGAGSPGPRIPLGESVWAFRDFFGHLFEHLEQHWARQLGAHGMPRAVFRRDGDRWLVGFDGQKAFVASLKGMRCIHMLLQRPNVVISASEIDSGAVVKNSRQDVMDTEAVQRIELRMKSLKDAREEARALGKDEEAASIEGELEGLAHEVRRAQKPRGRLKAFADGDEKARNRVGQAMKVAVDRIYKNCPPLGDHLKQSLRDPFGSTPAYCPEQPVDWSL